jgi:glycosyltransferase involved in cell wall biosynthesis
VTLKKMISIAIPAYNEEKNLLELIERLQNVFSQLSEKYRFEVVVCENGSSDNSFETLKVLNSKDERIKTIRLVRNFNMEGGMMAALAHVEGDACVIMSADLQDPPEMIPALVEKWEQGYENVYTVITKRHGEGIARRTAAQIFYWAMYKVSDHPVPRNASDFRLVSKAAYEAFNRMPERVRLIRAVWGWLGFRSVGIAYERPARRAGVSSFKPFVTAPYAVRAILGSSYTPLRLIPLVGILISLLSFMAIGVMGFVWIWFGVPFPGFGSLVTLNLMMFGLVFLFMGILSEYVGVIHEEIRQRPSFLVAESIGIESRD